MFLNSANTHLLSEIGFTKTQAKLYFILLKLGKTDANKLSENSNIASPAVYRTLHELSKMGLVETEIGLPYKYRATPLRQGLEILLNQKFEQLVTMRQKTEELILTSHFTAGDIAKEDEYFLRFLAGKTKIMQTIKNKHDFAKQKIRILSTIQRWLFIIDCCLENYKDALNRNIQYEIVLNGNPDNLLFPKNIRPVLENPQFKIKLIQKPLSNNFIIFDNNEAIFNFLPGKTLGKSPVMWTNHPGLICMAIDHFEKIWKNAEKISVPKKIKHQENTISNALNESAYKRTQLIIKSS